MDFNSNAYLTNDVKHFLKDLKSEYNLTDYEALMVALKAEQNNLLKKAFVISATDSTPTGLEAIAISLGYRGEF
ncbi:MAG: hypothetical protein SCALA702_02060 [Melioribacteraceae bacterium]|nr:MAG: hypothetical protein SCALA702_02060 [Melioribacteraceae bacterium]